MIYVMSDIHGCYQEFLEMIKKIELQETDTLYILGDVIDRGTGSLEILDYIISHKNIEMLLGNHEDLLLKWYHSKLKLFPYIIWKASTINMICLKQFKKLKKEEQDKYIQFLKKCKLCEIIEINDKEYLLVHGGINFRRSIDAQKRYQMLWISKDFILNKNNTGYTIIFGHTSIREILEMVNVNSYGGIYINLPFERTLKRLVKHRRITNKNIRILKWNNKIAIDCGCIHGNKLGCIRLDDMKEFYVERK